MSTKIAMPNREELETKLRLTSVGEANSRAIESVYNLILANSGKFVDAKEAAIVFLSAVTMQQFSYGDGVVIALDLYIPQWINSIFGDNPSFSDEVYKSYRSERNKHPLWR